MKLPPAAATLALWGLAVACEPSLPPAGPAASAGTLAVPEAELFYQKLGAGDPVVVVHGGPGLDHTYLRPWFGPLAETHEVIFYDQRGLGRSDAVISASSISMERYLTDLDRIREGVAEAERFTVAAHSWGTIPALLYALERPERLKALILVAPVEPGRRYYEPTEENRAARTDPADRAAIDSILALPGSIQGEVRRYNQLFFHVFRATFANPSVADRRLRLTLHERTVRQGQRVASLIMTPLEGLDFWDRLGDIDVPVLIVHGRQDLVPVQMVERLDEALPDSRLALIDGAGHFPFIEQPEQMWAAVQDFLAERQQDAS